ncbi:MAG: response regulator transcription factor [Candidatus Sericytochromatia bacterium]|nr:response regulator transcription factor [Candidatus Sericytochromatia bacterium]
MSLKRVMIVEDDADVRGLLGRYLEHRAFACEPVASGAQCLRLLTEAPPPDLILLDHELPDMDGKALTSMIRARADVAAVPILLITGRKLSPEGEAAREAGVDACLYKPFSPRALLAQVRSLLGELG